MQADACQQMVAKSDENASNVLKNHLIDTDAYILYVLHILQVLMFTVSNWADQ